MHACSEHRSPSLSLASIAESFLPDYRIRSTDDACGSRLRSFGKWPLVSSSRPPLLVYSINNRGRWTFAFGRIATSDGFRGLILKQPMLASICWRTRLLSQLGFPFVT